MEWVACIAVAVLAALGVRYVVRQMRRSAQELRDAIAKDEIEAVKAWRESKRRQPHG